MTVPYQIADQNCYAATIGEGGVDGARVAALAGTTVPILTDLAARRDDGRLPVLSLPQARADLAEIVPVAKAIRDRFETVVILGTGGSSLGGRTLWRLVDRGFGPPAGTPRLIFFENVDPDTFEVFFSRTDPARLAVIAISKSGRTPETLAQLVILMDFVARARGTAALTEQFFVVTQPGDHELGRIAARWSIRRLEHPPTIGGRFAVLSVVGLLPGLIAGLDVAALRAGAAEVVAETLDNDLPPDVKAAVRGAAMAVVGLQAHGLTQSVFMPYIDRLSEFGFWYRQLWAESLGKQGQGITPIRALGTVDQHSQLQLYLDGPRDKLFTIVQRPYKGRGPWMSRTYADGPDYLLERPLGDLMDAEQQATVDTLAAHGRPVRVIQLRDRLDLFTVGALLMHFMLETMVAAALLGVNAFDQPAVEDGKKRTRDSLSDRC